VIRSDYTHRAFRGRDNFVKRNWNRDFRLYMKEVEGFRHYYQRQRVRH